MAKHFRLRWIYEPFEDSPSFFAKPMFGGLAVYLHEKMVLVLTESEGDRRWKDQEYPFDLWNGILFPTERDHHISLIGEFGCLRPHPALGKWLYLPLSEPGFEAMAIRLAGLIASNDPRMGIYPKRRKKSSSRKARKKTANKKEAQGKKKRKKLGALNRQKLKRIRRF